MFNIKVRTRYSETGQDGIIHHSSYVVYLEEARIAFFTALGIDINALEQQKIFCPVVDLYLKYLKPLYSMQDVRVQVAIESCSKVRFALTYRILRDDVCVAQGTTSHCFTNASFKPIPIPQEMLQSFNQMLQVKK
jgi:acyl-CoA thioester hydrolase